MQKAFLDALDSDVTDVAGPQAEDHLAAVRMALATGLAAVSIEPAALSVGAEFHALEVHEAQLWIADRWMDDPIISHSLTTLLSRRFRARLEGVGGYDLTDSGLRIVA